MSSSRGEKTNISQKLNNQESVDICQNKSLIVCQTEIHVERFAWDGKERDVWWPGQRSRGVSQASASLQGQKSSKGGLLDQLKIGYGATDLFVFLSFFPSPFIPLSPFILSYLRPSATGL